MKGFLLLFNRQRDFSCADHIVSIELGTGFAHDLDPDDAGDLDYGHGSVYTVPQVLFDQLHMLAELTQHHKRPGLTNLGVWYAIPTEQHTIFIDLLKKAAE
jgi:hypothetical protein